MGLVSWIIRSLRIPGTWMDSSDCVAHALAEAAIRTGDRRSASSLDLLAAVLQIQDAGLRRCLAHLGCDPDVVLEQALASLKSGYCTDRSCLAVARDAYRVVPTTAIHLVTSDGCVINRKQTLHSCHLLAGFSRQRRSDASLLLSRLGFERARLGDIAAEWLAFQDAS